MTCMEDLVAHALVYRPNVLSLFPTRSILLLSEDILVPKFQHYSLPYLQKNPPYQIEIQGHFPCLGQ